MLGDGNVFDDPAIGAYKVSIVGSFSTVRRWLDLIAPFNDPQEIKREFRTRPTYQGQVYSKQLIEWFRINAFTGPKCTTLPWPEDLPNELMLPFLRGLWDTDGSISIFRHPNTARIPEFKASFGVKARPFVERVHEELRKRLGLPDVAIRDTAGITVFSFGDASAKLVADFLYKDSPEHLRNEDRYDIYKEMCRVQEHHDSIMCFCGAKAEREGHCIKCWYEKVYVSKVDNIKCSCGNPVHAKGLCSACYTEQIRAEAVGETLEEARAKICKTRDCGKRAATGKDECRNCILTVHKGECSTCHERPGNCAFGLCKACYERQRRAKAAQQVALEDGVPYVHKPAGRPDLDKFNDEIVAAYKSGVSAAQLAKTYRASGPTIADRLRKAGVHIRKRWEDFVPTPELASETSANTTEST